MKGMDVPWSYTDLGICLVLKCHEEVFLIIQFQGSENVQHYQSVDLNELR